VVTGLLLGLLWLVGCSGGGSTLYNANNTPGVGAPGTVSLLLSDAPLDNVSAVNVNIVRIDLVYDGAEDSLELCDPDGDGEFEDPDDDDELTAVRDEDEEEEDDDDDRPITVFQGNVVVNLLDLANQPLDNLLQLSQVAVPSGKYEEAHIYLGTNNTVVLLDGTVQPLTVVDREIEVEMDTFIIPGETETVLLDFDLSDPDTLQEPADGHGWILDLEIRVACLNNTGNVIGVLGVPDGFVPTSEFEVEVTIQTLYDEVETDVEVEPDDDDWDGNPYAFYLHGVPPGDHTVTFTAEYGEQTSTFTAPVTVVRGETTDMGTVPVSSITF
jgi:hypothetical protein